MPTSSSYFTRRKKSNTNPQKPSSSSIMKSSNGSQTTRNDNQINKVVRYKECRKNHAANIGGYAVDGCREFMASGLEGTNEAFICAACTCHRSFHKREVENQVLVLDCSSRSNSDDS